MDIGMTLLGQALSFAVLIWVTVKFIWPPLMAGSTLSGGRPDVSRRVLFVRPSQSHEGLSGAVDCWDPECSSEANRIAPPPNTRSRQAPDQSERSPDRHSEKRQAV